MPFVTTSMLDGGYGPQAWQTFNAWWPTAAGKYRVFVLVHGGGWSLYDKTACNDLAMALAAKGSVAFTIEFKQSAPAAPSWPQCVDDLGVFDAWLRSLNLGCTDLTNVTYYGASAGGHLALMASTRGIAPQRVVTNCAPLDLTPNPYPTWLETHIAQMLGPAPRLDASPRYRLGLKPASTKWVLFQAYHDTAVLQLHQTDLVAAAYMQNVPLEYALLPGAHCFTDWSAAAISWPDILWRLSNG